MKGLIGILLCLVLLGHAVMAALSGMPVLSGICVLAALLTFMFWPVDRSADR